MQKTIGNDSFIKGYDGPDKKKFQIIKLLMPGSLTPKIVQFKVLRVPFDKRHYIQIYLAVWDLFCPIFLINPWHTQLTYGGGGRPYSSLALRDYDPLMSDTYGMDQSRSYLGGRSLSGGAASSLDGHLRDTAISGLGHTSEPYDDRSRFLASRRFVGMPSAKAAQRGEIS